MPVIPALRRLKGEHLEFKVSLGIAISKKKKTKKIFVSCVSDKRIKRIYRELKKLTLQRINNH
jgi:hypothetical protein